MFKLFQPVLAIALCVVASIMTPTTAQSGQIFADTVENYIAGSGTNSSYTAAGGIQALGAPARDAGFGSQTGVFYAPFLASDLTQIGGGGSLTVSFADPVSNDPLNPFGIDLLVFGNAFYVSSNGVVTGAFEEPATISVSQDNIQFFDIPNVFGDTAFPTLGYSDTVYSGFGNSGGTILTDFSKPVDPSFDATGLTEAQINAAYAGSGGGTGVDIGSVGLDWIRYVRVSLPDGAGYTAEFDAFADVAAVPEPSGLAFLVIAAAGLALQRRRQD